MIPSQMTAEQLQEELEWSKAQNAQLYEEFCALRTRMTQAAQMCTALEKERDALQLENEDLRRTLLACRQKDALGLLRWKKETIKNEQMVLVTGCDASCSGVCIPEQIDNCVVLGVEQEAFCGCAKLAWVRLPQGMRAIAARAFADCPALEHVYLPQSIVWISPDAFCGAGQVTLYCAENSPAAAFARENGIAARSHADYKML